MVERENNELLNYMNLSDNFHNETLNFAFPICKNGSFNFERTIVTRTFAK